MRARVLLAAPEVELRARLGRELQSSGYAVELASDEKRALRLATDSNFNLAIVAPGPSPTSLAMALELRDTVPAMIVLADGPNEIAHLRCLLPNVDEFLLKSSTEGALTDRVSELIALADGTAHELVPIPSILYIGRCKLDLAGHVFVDGSGREVALTRAESDLLKILARSPCQVLSRDKLRCAGRRAEPFDRSTDMLVARLRRKIEPDPKAPRFIVTVPGVGYKLMARPQPAEAQRVAVESTQPERRQITVLCCKLVGAMGFAVNFEPEDLIEITRDFQDAAVAAIAALGGTIASVTPDEIQAFFGYPEAHKDHAERAVSAGFNVVAEIGQLLSPKGEPLQARVAAATGLALVSQRQVIGEPYFIAAGICDLTEPNSVLATATTRSLLSGAFVCGEPERYVLAGVSDPVRGYRVTTRARCSKRANCSLWFTAGSLRGSTRDLMEAKALLEELAA
jgi:DNA-binding response OmpR family regulator/class 3 adenylate cyclase